MTASKEILIRETGTLPSEIRRNSIQVSGLKNKLMSCTIKTSCGTSAVVINETLKELMKLIDNTEVLFEDSAKMIETVNDTFHEMDVRNAISMSKKTL